MATIIEQRVDCFLQHALFISNNDVRGLELEQILETIIPVNDAAIQIVQITRREPPTFQRHKRAQIRRNHRQHIQDHPIRTGV